MEMDLAFKILQSISVITASIVTICGITSWRREAKWKRKYELAEEVLSLFYECKEKIAIIRSPHSYSKEGKTRKRGENESQEETERLYNAYVFIERYDKEKEPFIKLWTLKFRFMALFGKEANKPFDEISQILNSIFLAAHHLGQRYWKEQGQKTFTDAQFEKHLQVMNKYEKIIWADYDESDEITSQVNSCISKIEKYCVTIMKK